MFVILSCPSCVKSSKGNTFFQDVKELQLRQMEKAKTPDYINFFIKFAGLCCTYPKFKFVPWNYTKLKKYMPELTNQLKIDEHIWK